MTGLQLLQIAAKAILGGASDLQPRVLEYVESLVSRVLSAYYDAPGLLATTMGLTVGTTGTPAVPAMSIEVGTFRAVAGDGGDTAASVVMTWADTDDGFTGVPFDDTVSANVFVTANKYPDGVRSGTDGVPQYLHWTWGIGVVMEPDDVQVVGDDLVFTVDTAAGGVWASSDASRPVRIWKKTPETSVGAQAIQEGDAVSDGVNVTVTLADTTLGQDTPSGDPSDYWVFVPGLHISTDAALLTDSAYVFVGSHALGVPTTDGVVEHATPQQLSEAAQELHALIRPAPGIYMGGLAAMQAWVAPANVTIDDTGDPVTFTFTDPAGAPVSASDWVLAALGRWMSEFETGGLVASLPQASAADTYVIYASPVPVDGGAPRAELLIETETAFSASLNAAHVVLFRFDYDGVGGPGSVTNAEAGNVVQSRGVIPAGMIGMGAEDTESGAALHAVDLVLHPVSETPEPTESITAAPKAIVRVANGGTFPQVEFFGFTPSEAAAPDAAHKLLGFQKGYLNLPGPGGSGVDIGAGNSTWLDLGKAGAGLAILAVGGATSASDFLQICRAAVPADVFAAIFQSGGQQTDQVNSLRPVTKVTDLVLTGGDGKLCTVGLDLLTGVRPASDDPNPWAINDGSAGNWLWEHPSTTTAGKSFLRVAIPHGAAPGRGPAGVGGGGTGASARLCRCIVSGELFTAAGLGDQLDAQIEELDPATGTWSVVGANVAIVQDAVAVGTVNVEINGSTDPDSLPDGITMDGAKQYALRVDATNGAAAGVEFRLRSAKAVFRVYEFGAGAP